MNKSVKKITSDLIKALATKGSDVQHFDSSPLPDKREVYQAIEDLQMLLFPGYFRQSGLPFETVEWHLGFTIASLLERLKAQIHRESLHSCRFPHPGCRHCSEYAELLAQNFLLEVPSIRRVLEADVRAAFKNDPAASGFDEIIFSYPGLEAIAVYRLAHYLHQQGLFLIPRIMTEWAHSRTGVDIHPGATIGEGFFIDHGTGVVIGETTTIGRDVTLYQGVTLGALNFPRDAKGNVIRRARRHPTIEDGVVIYAGATILGGNTTIGEGSVIGGNVWLTESVPPHSRVVLAKNDLQISRRQAPPQIEKSGGSEPEATS